jgi:DNA-binding response OmpR family regulator
MPVPRNILVIEDDRDIGHLLHLHLSDAGHAVTLTHDGQEGLARALSSAYDLIILDLMLPGMNGLDLCRRLRQERRYTPILMLTARTAELDRVLGLETGADDYLTKPFSIMELLARVKAIFRRLQALDEQAASPPHRIIQVNGLIIDTSRRLVMLAGDVQGRTSPLRGGENRTPGARGTSDCAAGEPVDLTAKEFDLLTHFALHPGQVFTRGQLLDRVWGYGHDGYEHTVNSHINRLRAKIERNPAKPRYILTVWGVGYKFAEPHSAAVTSA